MKRKPEISDNDVADAMIEANAAAAEAAVRRTCAVMGWEYKKYPVWTGIRALAVRKAVAISVEKLHEMLDRISPRPGLCEHGIADGEWCESCNREAKEAREENQCPPSG